MTRHLTPNRAAANVRSAVLRKMKELDANKVHSLSGLFNWESLRAYIKGMAKRASEKKGGLGKK